MSAPTFLGHAYVGELSFVGEYSEDTAAAVVPDAEVREIIKKAVIKAFTSLNVMKTKQLGALVHTPAGYYKIVTQMAP